MARFWIVAIALAWVACSVAGQDRVVRVVGVPCHGAMNFNGQSLLATEPNYEEFLDRLQPASQGLFREFRLAEIGAVDSSTGDVGLITADTPTDSLMAKWADNTSRALFTSLGSNYTKYEAQIGEPLHVVYSAVRDSLERSDETLKNVNDPDVTKFDVTVNFQDMTVEQWNSASATMDVGCREDGTGWYNVTGEGFLPHQTSSHFVVGAWTSQDEAIWINPFGGFPSLVSTNENGELRMYRDLQYCPLDLDDPVMFTFLLWHFGGSSWGIYPNGPEVLVGIHTAPNMCFTLGPKLVSPELDSGVFVSGRGLAK